MNEKLIPSASVEHFKQKVINLVELHIKSYKKETVLNITSIKALQKLLQDIKKMEQ